MLEQLIAMTQNVILEDGLEDYLPVLLLPDIAKVIVLEAELEGDNHESAAADWIAERVGPEDNFLVAFKSDPHHFKIRGRVEGMTVERVCPAGRGLTVNSSRTRFVASFKCVVAGLPSTLDSRVAGRLNSSASLSACGHALDCKSAEAINTNSCTRPTGTASHGDTKEGAVRH